MPSLNPVRGTHDILPDDNRRYRRVEETAYHVAERFGYGEITTPVFEFTEVFSRTLGDTSDIVTKEMYTFEDKGGDKITLRPEGTAGVARAYISNGLQQNLPLKFFYRGPMFRYERPQKGRWREFRQVGVELMGVDKPTGDIEVISLAYNFLRELGLADAVTLEINSLGDAETRLAYRETLVDYLSSHGDALSEDSRERLDRNPLRVLDSKDARDREIVANAPILRDSLNGHSRSFFDEVLAGIESLDIPYTLNPTLVRGLDYYCHTAFVFTPRARGALGAVRGGGRYAGTRVPTGGPATPGVGWAAGVERLSLLVEDGEPKCRPIALIPVGDAANAEMIKIAHGLRAAGFVIEMGYSGNLARRMKRADRLGAVAALLLGDDELARGTVTLRDMDSGEQSEVPLADIRAPLEKYRG
ncbi:MAG: histidine--tRNA ligase [Rhodospirillales bacterium]|nr:histidine--tRNA ligase [Rhodospirillales bacterium]